VKSFVGKSYQNVKSNFRKNIEIRRSPPRAGAEGSQLDHAAPGDRAERAGGSSPLGQFKSSLNQSPRGKDWQKETGAHKIRNFIENRDPMDHSNYTKYPAVMPQRHFKDLSATFNAPG
jgi:hypothetical protein